MANGTKSHARYKIEFCNNVRAVIYAAAPDENGLTPPAHSPYSYLFFNLILRTDLSVEIKSRNFLFTVFRGVLS